MVRLALPLYRVWVTYALLALMVGIFGAQLAGEWFLGQDVVLGLGIKWNEGIAAGELWRLVTPIFLHLSVLHIALNGFALYQLGRLIETFYGAARFLALFFLAGVAGCLASLWFNIHPSAGASGAIFGLIGAEIVLFYRNRRWLGESGAEMLRNAIVVAGLNFFIGLSGSIDNWGHAGGFVGGLAVAWLIGPLWALPEVLPFGALPQLVNQHPLTPLRWLMLLGVTLALLGGAVAYMMLY